MHRIYLDHNATTPLAPACLEAMTVALREEFGNPSSVHHFGQRAKSVIDDARSQVSKLINADPSEVVFTGSGTESDNLAVRGAAEALEPTGRRHLVVSAIEHEAVLNTAKALGRRGWQVSLIPVGQSGIIDPDALLAVLTDRTALVSAMHANNEVGTIQPIATLAAAAKAVGALMHVDAVQSAGKIPLDVRALGADLVSISAHKFYGPKGVGALWIRRGVRLVAATTGGRHERGRRAGTENVAGIVGMGVAARLAREHFEAEGARVAALRDRLEEGILRAVSGTIVNGDRGARVPNTTNISFDRVEAESLLIGFDLAGIAVSTGSACSSGTLEPSHVLKAMGFPPHRTQNSIRFSLGASTTEADVDRTIAAAPGIVDKLRNLTRSPVRA
ncbi:MAG TPA: cysteine desulfurase family protein [Vicinamibacterales bacterium]